MWVYDHENAFQTWNKLCQECYFYAQLKCDCMCMKNKPKDVYLSTVNIHAMIKCKSGIYNSMHNWEEDKVWIKSMHI